MASLKNIMNTEDDSTSAPIPHEPGPSQSSLRPDSSASASTYPTTTTNRDYHHMSTASHNSMLDPTKLPSRFFMTDTSSSSSSVTTIPGRRPSNTSVDSMESPYGPSHSASSSNSPMRPFTTNMAAEPRVKLTPITGKISKAKKGVPVHNCDQCVKTFTRAEHLRRHQLTHAPPDLCCRVPNCGRTFYRKDLLERHMQRHEPNDGPSAETKQSPRRRSSKSSNHSYDNLPQQSGRLQMPEAFASHRSNAGNELTGTSAMAPNMTPGMGSAMGPSSWQSMAAAPGPSQNHTSPPPIMDTGDEYMDSEDYDLHQTMPNLNTTTTSMASTFAQQQPRGMPEPLMLYIPPPTWPDSTMPSSASESTYSTPSDNTRHHRLPVRTSSGDWNQPLAPYQVAANGTGSPGLDNGGFPMPFTYSASPPMYQMYDNSMGVPLPGYPEENAFFSSDQIPVTTVRSLSPQMAVAQSSETLVTISSAPAPDHIFHAAMCGHPSAEGLGILAPRDTMPVPLTRAARDTIPIYLNVYWDKVHPIYPVVHKPSFENVPEAAAEHVDVLQCAMAAVATQFLSSKDDRMKGAELYNYAWQTSKVFTQADEWPLPVKQTVLLCEYYARFRGRRKESYKPSPRFGSLYHRVFKNQNAFAPIPTEHDAMEEWAVWIDMETRRRLLAACFLLDVHSACYYQQRRASISGLDYSFPDKLPIPLPSSTAQLWEAANPQDWSMLRTRRNPTTLRDINLGGLTSTYLATAPSFDAAILLAAYALYLPDRHTTQLDLIEDVSRVRIEDDAMVRLFPNSAIANTYLALRHTPLHCLLSVSGDSWVFNKKVVDASSFMEHKKRLNQWRKSGSATMATYFATRALKAFLGLGSTPEVPGDGATQTQRRQGAFWKDISDYWGVYVCALICWAFGHTGRKRQTAEIPSQEAAIQWIMTVADMDPAQIADLSDRRAAHEVVSLARAELAVDCLGGRNILFADAVEVLKKLEQGDNWNWA